MESSSSWTKVRQLAANRVLTRHLQDLHEQQVAMETTQTQHTRHRAPSLHPEVTDPLMPNTSRRRSIPTSSGLLPDTATTSTTTSTSPTTAPSRPPTRRNTRPKAACHGPGGGGRGGRGGGGGGGEGGGGEGGNKLAAGDMSDRRQSSLDRAGPDIGRSRDHQHEDCDTGDNLLEQMASTLRTARATEQQRPHLHPPPSSQLSSGKVSSPGSQSRESDSTTAATSTHSRPMAASTKGRQSPSFGGSGSLADDFSSRPRLEREETFIQIDQAQVLAFGGAASPNSLEDPPHSKAGGGGKARKRTRQKKGRKGVRRSDGKSDSRPYTDSGATPHGESLEGGSVNVDFYDEDTGLKKDDGGFTPRDMTLPLHMLRGDDDEDAKNEDSVRETLVEEEKDDYSDDNVVDDDCGEEDEVDDDGGDPWNEIKKCQYIRGYDPPHMRMPRDTVKFVFGNK